MTKAEELAVEILLVNETLAELVAFLVCDFHETTFVEHGQTVEKTVATQWDHFNKIE